MENVIKNSMDVSSEISIDETKTSTKNSIDTSSEISIDEVNNKYINTDQQEIDNDRILIIEKKVKDMEEMISIMKKELECLKMTHIQKITNNPVVLPTVTSVVLPTMEPTPIETSIVSPMETSVVTQDMYPNAYTKICSNYSEKGFCTHKKCRFVHLNLGQDPTNKFTEFCKYFASGKCTKEDCIFIHAKYPEEIKSTYSMLEANISITNAYTKLCTNYNKKGFCTYKECKFVHLNVGQDPTNKYRQFCKFFPDGKCKKDDCTYIHAKYPEQFKSMMNS